MAKIVIIGGGVIGLSIARQLRLEGVRDITVIDRAAMGREASWAAAGMLAPNAETETIDDFYRLCADSNRHYGAFAAELLAETDIDIEFRPDGTLELSFDETGSQRLEQKFGRQKRAGIEVEMLTNAEIRAIETAVSPSVVSGLLYPNDGHVENRKLVDALVEYSKRNGIHLLQNIAAEELIMSHKKVTGVRTATGTTSADVTILANGAWSSLIKIGGSAIPFNIKPIRGQMLAFGGSSGMFEKVIYGSGAYLVPRADGRILVGATVEDAGFVRAVTEDGVRELREAGIRTMPGLADLDMIDSWSGFRPCSDDDLPILGQLDGVEGLTIATGHYRNGILLAPITARIIADLVVRGENSEYLKSFSPMRFSSQTTAAGETL